MPMCALSVLAACTLHIYVLMHEQGAPAGSCTCDLTPNGPLHLLTPAVRAQVIVAGRSAERCEEAVAEIKKEIGQSAGKLDVLEVDLASFR